MELLQTQIAFFINGKITPLETLVLRLKAVFQNPQIQYFPNLPAGMNLNIPLLTLSSQESKIVVTVYDSRVDVVFAGEINTDFLSQTIESITANKNHIFRVGFVKTSFNKVAPDFYRTLLSKEKIKRLDVKEIGFHINVRKEIVGHVINSIEKANPGNVEKDNVKQEGIIIQRDCNTLAEQQLSPELTSQKISELIEGLNNEAASSILI